MDVLYLDNRPITILQGLQTIELRRKYAKQLQLWECHQLIQFHKKLLEKLDVSDIICIRLVQNKDHFDPGDYCGVL